jgi:hypothetical protein
MNTTELQFNIIYTPDTARYLSMFVPSLLEWMDCRFRIISNGCPPEEVQILRDLCATSDRLEFLMMSEKGMIQHGQALNWLHERCDSKWFCYMDSDIIATGPFMNKVGEYLESCDVFSSGLPLWHAPEDTILPRSFKRMSGSHIWTDDGICIGCDYFAIFNNELLTRVKKDSGIGFETYNWKNIPENIQALLREQKLEKIDYDSGKVLTALLLREGARYQHENFDDLKHLGGFSALSGDGAAFIYRGQLDRIAVGWLGGLLSVPLLYLADYWYARTRRIGELDKAEIAALSTAERRILQSRIRKRLNTARYFNVMMSSILRGSQPPDYPILGYKPAERRLVEAAIKIREIIATHYPDKVH